MTFLQKLIFTGLIFLCALICVYLRYQIVINHDVAALYSIGLNLLSDGNMLRSAFDVNPPLNSLIYTPARLFEALGLSTHNSLFIWLTLSLTALLCTALYALSRCSFIQPPVKYTLGLGLIVTTYILPGYAYSQREHYIFLCLMILIFTSLHISLDKKRADTTDLALIALGSLAFLIKPFYLICLLPLAICRYVTRANKVLSLIGRDFLIIAGICLAYLISIYALNPEYLHTIIPLASEVYGTSYSTLFLSLLSYCFFMSLVMLALYAFKHSKALLPKEKLTTITMVSLLATYLICFWGQQKGFGYHAYPLLNLFIIVILYIHQTARRSSELPKLLLIIAITVTLFQTYNLSEERRLSKDTSQSKLETINQVISPDDTYMLIVPTYTPVHIFTPYLNGHRVGRFAAIWPHFSIMKYCYFDTSAPCKTGERQTVILENVAGQLFEDIRAHQPTYIFFATTYKMTHDREFSPRMQNWLKGYEAYEDALQHYEYEDTFVFDAAGRKPIKAYQNLNYDIYKLKTAPTN